MEREEGEPTPEKPLKVNIIKDSKQMRVTIPAWIVENFRINPQREQFAWFIQEFGENKDGNKMVRVVGTFVKRKQNDKTE